MNPLFFLQKDTKAFNPACTLPSPYGPYCSCIYAIMLPFSVPYFLKVFLVKNMFWKKLLKWVEWSLIWKYPFALLEKHYGILHLSKVLCTAFIIKAINLEHFYCWLWCRTAWLSLWKVNDYGVAISALTLVFGFHSLLPITVDERLKNKKFGGYCGNLEGHKASKNINQNWYS